MATQPDLAPLSFKEKLGYGLGDMASNFYLGFFGLFLLYFYTDVWGLAPAAVGTMLLLSKVVDAVTDPGMGLIADRTHSRWGKYRPYLLFGAIPYGILGYLIFLAPDLSDSGKLIYAYVTYIGVMLAFTSMNVPYSALLAVISPVAAERTKATTYRLACAGFGTLSIAAFATPLVNWLGKGDEAEGYRLTMLVFAILAVVLFIITFSTTKERIEPNVHHHSSVKSDLKALVKNISWIVLSFTGVLLVIGIAVRTSSIVFYVKYAVGDDGTNVFLFFDKVAVYGGLGLVGQIIGASITPLLSARFEKHYLVFAMCATNAGILLLGFFIPPENYWTTIAIHILSFLAFGVCITLLFTMYTDCTEYSEWLSGKNMAGLIVSSSLFALKMGVAIGGALPGFMLTATGYVANQAQTAEALAGIQSTFFLAPALVFFLAGALMLLYKIDRGTLSTVEADLTARRNKMAPE